MLKRLYLIVQCYLNVYQSFPFVYIYIYIYVIRVGSFKQMNALKIETSKCIDEYKTFEM